MSRFVPAVLALLWPAMMAAQVPLRVGMFDDANGNGRRDAGERPVPLIGKESRSLELVEAGMLGDWSAIQTEYGTNGRPSTEILHAQPATAIARAWNVSVRTVR